MIEVGRGFVGVDEACSGIRSLQAVLMVSLFLGEMHRLSPARRIGIFLAGVGLALLFNLGRTLFLTWQAVNHGLGAVERWHDLAGNAALVATLGALYFVADHQSRRPRPPTAAPAFPTNASTAPGRHVWAAALLASALLIEGGTQLWFHRGQRLELNAATWEVRLPVKLPSYAAQRFTKNEEAVLISTNLHGGQWTDAQGAPRAAYIFAWDTGQTARFVPFNHNPAVCFPSAGCELAADLGIIPVTIGDTMLPFRSYRFRRGGEEFHVFYLVWDNGRNQPLRAEDPTQGSLVWLRQAWDEVRLRRLNINAQMFIYAMFGASEGTATLTAFQAEVRQVLAVRPSAPAP